MSKRNSYVKIETIKQGSRVDRIDLTYEDLKFIKKILDDTDYQIKRYGMELHCKDMPRLTKLIKQLKTLA